MIGHSYKLTARDDSPIDGVIELKPLLSSDIISIKLSIGSKE